jgi:SanA protein
MKVGTILAIVKKIFNMGIHILFWLGITATLLVCGARLFTGIYAHSRISAENTVKPSRVAIVFGAGLQRDGSPSPVFAGKVEKLLFSGDNRFVDYNEPGAMRAYAITLGVPEDAIVMDYAGRRTYDTCYRAKYIFGVTEAILVTQNYHQPRALFTCNELGVKSVGVDADQRTYSRSSRLVWNIRELPASLVAMWDVWIAHPVPVLGDPEPIFTEKK